MVLGVLSKVLVKSLMAGVMMDAGRMRMSKSSLEARDLVSIGHAAYRTGTSVFVCAICGSRSASCWAL